MKLAQLDSQELAEKSLDVSVDFKPFELPARQEYRPRLSKKTQKRAVSPWVKLDRAIRNLKLTSLAQIQKRIDLEQENIFTDYSAALRELRRDFLYAVVPTLKSDEVRTMSSSANPAEVIGGAVRESSPTRIDAPAQTETLVSQPVVNHKNFNNPEANSNVRISQRLTEVMELPKAIEIPAPKVARVQTKIRKRPAVSVAPPAPAAATPAHTAASTEVAQAIDVDAEVRNLVQLEAITGRNSTAKIPDEATEQPAPAPAAQVAEAKPQEFSTYFNPGISAEDQKVLTEALLNEQLKALNGAVAAVRSPAAKSNTLATATAGPAAKSNSPATQAPTWETPALQSDKTGFGDKPAVNPDDQTLPEDYSAKNAPAMDSGCAQLPKTRFINSMGKQICPAGHSWISKSWAGSGWLKVESENSPSLLTYYPSPNTGNALVLETNSLAFLGLASGARVQRGMGIIVGTVPEGYDVEFVGRAEEAEYFPVQGTRHFAIINAEPGAGVVQLTSQKDQQDTATIFAPVMEDTITYLDLAAPQYSTFTVRVVKNGGQDPEVAGLTVGISTQGKIQAITQSNGRALVRDAKVIPGYPVYIDVSSRIKNERSYTYRYLLKNRNRLGEYVVYQVAEKSLYRWIKQVKQGLSDQSAMVVGFFDRKRLGGFKEHHFVKANPLTSKFGLEPLNYSILWDGTISPTEPLEGDLPRFMSVQLPEGLTQVRVAKESGEPVLSELIPVSPRVIHVVSE